MNWPEAFERSSAHFASAYLWHDLLTSALSLVLWGVGTGIGLRVGLSIIRFGASAMDAAERRRGDRP